MNNDSKIIFILIENRKVICYNMVWNFSIDRLVLCRKRLVKENVNEKKRTGRGSKAYLRDDH